MPLLFKSYVFLGILVALVSSSCVNLKHIAEFSETSLEGIGQYEQLASSFHQRCEADCEQQSIRNLTIHDVTCNCTPDKKADSITTIIYKSISGYLFGLKTISASKLTRYQTQDLTDALTTGDFGPIKLNTDDVKAYSNISTVILRAFTDGYRRSKIKKYVSEAHEPLTQLVHFLRLNLAGNLNGKLEVQKSLLKNFYFDLVADEKLSVYERTKFAEDYFNSLKDIETKQEELKNFSKALESISEGHQVLYTHINNLTDDEVKTKLGALKNRWNSAMHTYFKTK
ncbi:hypothetical protein [Pareuzebyella sediminis]|uniref:hypothetical protein n=1 Tax=Pareuzebyella sediminis TaxID=2607998 RepID=UPI0011EF39FF|nr:hypothetical protein [Pareuzebyella sediminis]